MVPRIRQVQIQNYKSIGQAVVDLEPFTAFVGPNGAGKSNFVDALAFVQECLSTGIGQPWWRRGSVVPGWSHSKEVCVGFRFLLELAGGASADYAFEISGSSPRIRVAHERCWIHFPGREKALFEIVEGDFIHPIPGIRPRLEPDRLALFAASAVEEFRPVYDFLSEMRLYSIKPSDMQLSARPEAGKVLSFSGGNAAAVLRWIERTSPEVSERISQLLAYAVQGIQAVKTRTQNDQVVLEFQKDLGAPGSVSFPSTQVSEGTLRILGLLLAVFQPLRPSVLVIEEPEATVHPAAAELVVQVLLNAAQDRQVLITTHSPDILDAKELADNQIRVVTMEAGRTVIAPLSRASRKAIRERLYTPGELLRIDELNQDLAAAREAAHDLDLFGGPLVQARS
jgi:predicted ATPase